MKKILYYLVFCLMLAIIPNIVFADDEKKITTYVDMPTIIDEYYSKISSYEILESSGKGTGTTYFDSFVFTAKSSGTYKVKVNLKDKTSRTYIVIAQAVPSSVSELDPKYEYGNIKKPGSRGGEKIKFGDLVFSGYKFSSDRFLENSGRLLDSYVVCEDKTFTPFSVVYKDNSGEGVKGFGCRKLKDSDEFYEKKNLNIGQRGRISNADGAKCSIKSGDSIKLDWLDNCVYTASKVGKTKVVVKKSSGEILNYIEYNVIDASNVPSSINDFDQKYEYVGLNTCKVKVNGVYLDAAKSSNNGVNICYSAYFDSYSKLVCPKDYELYKSNFDLGGSIGISEVYLCRKLKEDPNAGGSETGEQPTTSPNYDPLECGIFTQELVDMITDALDLIKIAGPIIALVLGTIDFIKAMTSGDSEKELKTAFTRFSKRLVAAIILFLLPIILAFLLDIFLKGQPGYNPDNPYCGVVDWGD